MKFSELLPGDMLFWHAEEDLDLVISISPDSINTGLLAIVLLSHNAPSGTLRIDSITVTHAELLERHADHYRWRENP